MLVEAMPRSSVPLPHISAVFIFDGSVECQAVCSLIVFFFLCSLRICSKIVNERTIKIRITLQCIMMCAPVPVVHLFFTHLVQVIANQARLCKPMDIKGYKNEYLKTNSRRKKKDWTNEISEWLKWKTADISVHQPTDVQYDILCRKLRSWESWEIIILLFVFFSVGWLKHLYEELTNQSTTTNKTF